MKIKNTLNDKLNDKYNKYCYHILLLAVGKLVANASLGSFVFSK